MNEDRNHHHDHGDYAKGQDDEDDERHTGSFAEGQSPDHPHPKEDEHGDFAEGQESSEEHAHPEGSFAEGQGSEDDHEH